MARVTPSRSGNIEAPENSASLPSSSDFIVNNALKRHTILVCVLYSLNETGMPEGCDLCDPAVVWARRSYDSLT